ncbi:MAG: D-glycero-beta-D-manno-heptose-7-phosphate kinase [bacterium]|nr:D-glycero-beta-D-manno-heptose-7-phosphate kinase [bacterium]
MINLKPVELLDRCHGLHIAVVGDLMLDRYLVGKVERISPEAPVPIVDVRDEFILPGGAANVLQNISAVGAIPEPFGVIGEDTDGVELRQLLENFGCETDGIVAVTDRPTTVKTRVLADSHHVVRFDREHRSDISDAIGKLLVTKLRERIATGEIKAVILQDYNKGVLRTSVIREAIAIAREKNVPVLVDPKQKNFFEYIGVTVFKPNLREMKTSLNFAMENENGLLDGMRKLRELLQASYILLTRGAQGMTLHSELDTLSIPTEARKVADVSGAGDTVIAIMATVMAAGGDAFSAARIANCAAGIVVGEVGAVPVKIEDLREAVSQL